MSEEKYEPVSCDYHDELEAAAMHKREVELELDQDGVKQKLRGQVADVFSRDGAEFVRFGTAGSEQEIRLDHIISLDGKKNS